MNELFVSPSFSFTCHLFVFLSFFLFLAWLFFSFLSIFLFSLRLIMSEPKIIHEGVVEYESGTLLKEEPPKTRKRGVSFSEESPLLAVGSSSLINSINDESTEEGTTEMSNSEERAPKPFSFNRSLSCSHGSHLTQITSHLKTPRLVNREKKRAIYFSSNEGMRPYLLNLYHTSVSLSWTKIFAIFVLLYTLCFAFWGFVYWLIDINQDMRCIENIDNYLGAFFFAVQTQMTIGYGNMYPEDRCFMVVIAVTLHSLAGILLDALVLGVVYARFSRPQLRAQTILLSEKAVVTKNDRGERHLVIRLANLRRTQLIETHLRLILHRCVGTADGETVVDFRDLELEEIERPFLALPVLISHRLDEFSAINDISDAYLTFADPELIVMVEGIDATTSDSVQVLFSYKKEDIVFDHHFKQMISMDVDEEGNLSYFVDFEKFNTIIPDNPRP